MSIENEKVKKKAEEPEKMLERKELIGLQGRLSALIRQISGKQDVVVTTKLTPGDIIALTRRGIMRPEDAWFQSEIIDPKTKKTVGMRVRIPEKILEASENMAKGKAAHEAGHVAIS